MAYKMANIRRLKTTFIFLCILTACTSNSERQKRSISTALCTNRPEGCFCLGQDNSCQSCETNTGCCFCDEHCLTANDCCSDFTLYCTKGCGEINCTNGGICLEQNNRFTRCECQMDFAGTFCQKSLCDPFPTDVVFVLDNSESISDEYFKQGIEFLQTMPENFTVGSIDETFQIAVISVSDQTNVEFEFDDFESRRDFIDKLLLLQKRGGGSKIVQGLDKAKQLLYQRMHLQRNKFIVVLTDGLISTPRLLQNSYHSAFPIYALAVGEDVSHFYLEKITSDISKIFSTSNKRFWHQLNVDTIDSSCSRCNKSSETDVLVAIDATSETLQSRPGILTQIFTSIFYHLENYARDTHIAVVNFDEQLNTRFNFSQVLPTNTRELERKSSSIVKSGINPQNHTETLAHISSFLYDKKRHARKTARKILLIISDFEFQLEEPLDFNEDIRVFTVGLRNNENSFLTMTRITKSALDIGVIGNISENSIHSFIDFFLEQLSSTECS